MLCSMAAADAIQEAANLSVALKWPNDLVARSRVWKSASAEWRKLAGILTETELVKADSEDRHALAFVVVGIGINVNVPRDALPRLAPDATSILAETGRETNRTALLTALLEATEARYGRFRRGENPHHEWSKRLVTLGRHVRVATAEEVLHGVAEAVDEDGALLLRTARGSLRRLLVGDVTLARAG
jgi:BirA family biotin operon repressor/biotin-[acetyl-CoA-carboxylase] ligase